MVVRAMPLALIASLVLCFMAQAQFGSIESIKVEIMPPGPTSADEVVIKVELLSRCKVSFSELKFFPDWNLFEATVFGEPCVVVAIFPSPPPFKTSYTYHLGKLKPGIYRFRLLNCFISGSDTLCLRLWRKEFQVTETIERIIDVNRNSRIDDEEILFAIELWITGEKIPGTSKIIDDATILSLIQLWIAGTGMRSLRVLKAAGLDLQVQVHFFDLRGRLVTKAKTEDTEPTLVASHINLPNGVYLYVLSIKVNGLIVRKVGKVAVLR